MIVVTNDEMQALENLVDDKFHFTANLIIENVGLEGAAWIEKRIKKISSRNKFKEIVFLIGQGNNGSDALAMARHLKNRHYTCRAFLLFPDKIKQHELALQLEMAKSFGVKITEVREINQLVTYFTQAQENYFVVDGIFGTGLKLPISQQLFEVINLVNSYSDYTIAIDIPSGIGGVEGDKSSVAIMAQETLAIGAPKLTLFTQSALHHCGKITTLQAGLPASVLEMGDKFLIDRSWALACMKKRAPLAHKGMFGHVLVVGGSLGMTGAVSLAAQAAMGVGAGLVTVATWPWALSELVTRLPVEVMSGIIPQDGEDLDGELRELGRYSALLIGPGLGKGKKAREVILNALANFKGPLVIDADGINALDLKSDTQLMRSRPFPTILTPHLAEMARLIGQDVETVAQSPVQFLKEAVDDLGQSIILKGPCTYLALPSGRLFINYAPNDGLAKAGSGDVLAGLLTGLLGQISKEEKLPQDGGPEVEKALILALWCQRRAAALGAKALGTRSMKASTVIKFLPAAFGELDEDRATQNNFL